MITFLTVGRNDGYGVNLSKRTALSLNFFASLCEDEDDEVLYVDCNSPEDDCTLTEAIADTLTPEARTRLRTFRVRGEPMRRAIGETPLLFSDELARNVGIRRSNPNNRWLLSTNCDLLVQPVGGLRLSDLLKSLEPRFYVCPRVGAPPSQWQLLDRMDMGQVADFCDETIIRGARYPREREEPWLRFGSVGDFQLAPREQWFAIGGCEEAMKLWGHSDANNSLRLALLNGGGRTPDLGDVLRVIHLDHNLEPAPDAPAPPPKNDWKKWIEEVTEACATNSEHWGLPDEDIPVIRHPLPGELDAGAIIRARPRSRLFWKSLRLKLLNKFWRSASRAANSVEEKIQKK
jgi:hypothetical protein